MEKPNRYLLRKLIDRGELLVNRLEKAILPKPYGVNRIEDRVDK